MSEVYVEHDIVAIGAGPFNLGLAALASTVDDVDVVVLDREADLSWHPGVMFDDAMLQVSFLADLVTLVDPTHWLSFLAYLRDVGRMYPFYAREQFHPTRREYEDYLRWAASRLPSVRFSHDVRRVESDGELFRVHVERGDGTKILLRARNLVVAIGTEPAIPYALSDVPSEKLLHSGEFLHRTDDLATARDVTVVGSGQSGAEVALDLLRRNISAGPEVSWLSRTESFAPLDYSKLVLEMTTPDYVDYFHGLTQETKDELVARQWRHYKGISSDTIDQIHDVLYRRELEVGLADVTLRCGVAVDDATVDDDGLVRLRCRQIDTGKVFEHRTELVVAATGYRDRDPRFLAPLEHLIRRDRDGRYVVRRDHSVDLDEFVGGRIFVSHADKHSHGVAAPDLGMSAVRNATILNTITGREIYPLPKRTAFTHFALP